MCRRDPHLRANIGAAEDIRRNNDGKSGRYAAAEIEAQKFPGTPGALDFNAEQPQRQHVPKHVTDSGVQEHIGDNLPNGKRLYHLRGDKSEIFEKLMNRAAYRQYVIGQKQPDVRNEKPFHSYGKAVGRRIPIHVRTRTKRHRLRGSSLVRITEKTPLFFDAATQNARRYVNQDSERQPDQPIG